MLWSCHLWGDGQQLLECHSGLTGGSLWQFDSAQDRWLWACWVWTSWCTHIPAPDFSHEQGHHLEGWVLSCGMPCAPQDALFPCHVTRNPSPPHHQSAVGLPPFLGSRLGVLAALPSLPFLAFGHLGRSCEPGLVANMGIMVGLRETSSPEVK